MNYRIFSIEIYIKDIYKNGFKNIIFKNDYATNPMSITRTDDTIKVNSCSNCGLNSNSILETNDNFEITFDLTCNLPISGGLSCSIGINKSNDFGFESREYYNNNKWNLIQNSAVVGSYYDLTKVTTFNIKLKRISTTSLEFYVDSTLIKTFTNLNYLSNPLQFIFTSWTGNSQSYHELTNFQIRLL